MREFLLGADRHSRRSDSVSVVLANRAVTPELSPFFENDRSAASRGVSLRWKRAWSVGEGLSFAREHLQSYFLAPAFPLIFLGILTVALMLFGLVEGFLPWFGDI